MPGRCRANARRVLVSRRHRRTGARPAGFSSPVVSARIVSTLQAFIENYGYAAVFIGCFFEGETVLVLAGFAAHMGYLSLPWVATTAAAAGFLGDETFFALGRHYGDEIFRRFPILRPGEHKVRRLVARYGAYAAYGVRFLVGLRVAGPIAMGAARMPPWKFSPANLFGAITWSAIFSVAGYVFGEAFTTMLHRARHYEEIAFAILAVIGVIALSLLRRRAKRPS
jgi:membrane protein DedA with SNARE-associated domain